MAGCLEVAVVAQGSLDETLPNLARGGGAFMSEEEQASLGLIASPRLSISFETAVR